MFKANIRCQGKTTRTENFFGFAKDKYQLRTFIDKLNIRDPLSDEGSFESFLLQWKSGH